MEESDPPQAVDHLKADRLRSLAQFLDSVRVQFEENIAEMKQELEAEILQIDEVDMEEDSRGGHLVLSELSDSMDGSGLLSTHDQSMPDLNNVTLFFDLRRARRALRALRQSVCVLGTSTVRLLSCTESPGSISIRWQEDGSDSDSLQLDGSVPHRNSLQYLWVNALNGDPYDQSLEFSNVLLDGGETYILTGVLPGRLYRFRIVQLQPALGLYDDKVLGLYDEKVCAVSNEKVISTSMTPYEWSTATGDEWSLKEHGRCISILQRCCPPVRSKGLPVKIGFSISFRVLRMPPDTYDDAIGLISPSFHGDGSPPPGLQQSIGVISVSSNGLVTYDSTPMTNRLPAFSEGCLVSFNTERVCADADKVQVWVSVDDREVGLHWSIPSSTDHLGFICSFKRAGWELAVF